MYAKLGVNSTDYSLLLYLLHYFVTEVHNSCKINTVEAALVHESPTYFKGFYIYPQVTNNRN